jgi:hypothetical protein
MTSCVYTTTTTPDVPECRYHEKTIDLVVNQSEWKFDSQLKQYYVRFDLPEITAEVYDFGNFSVHREYNAGTPDAYQVALPQSVYMSEQVSNGIIYYTQHIDYRIGVGYAEIQVTNSDYAYDPYNPESMLFRLQLIW